jgi:dephospho-CoA kinase
MLEVGLTGGIGAGKSTVASLLVARGAVLIDADAIVRELQEPGESVFDAMVAHFGPGIVGPDGTLDRPAVASIVFSDPDELAVLNSLVHPAVVAEMTRRRRSLAGTDATVVLDIPLLVEGGYRDVAVIVVDIDPDVAVRRLVDGRGLDESDARARVAAQASRADRLAAADFVIDNSGDPDDLAAEVDRCWEWICALSRPEPGTIPPDLRDP